MIKQNLTNHNIKYVQTYDFKTLDNDSPQQKLIDNITQFVTTIFQLNGKKYINIYNKNASLSDKINKNGSFTKKEFISQITYLIKNAFIYFNN